MQSVDSEFHVSLQKAMQHLAVGEGDKIIAVCKKLEKKYPGNFDVLHLYGIGFRLLGRFDKALEFYQKALDVNPEGSATLFCNLSFAYLENKDGDVFKAFEYAEKAKKRAPELQEVYEVSADVALRVGDAISAGAHVRKALEISSKNPILWMKLARVHRIANQLDEALENIKQALAIQPDSSELLVELGNIRELRGETDKALDAYQKAIEQGAEDVENVNQKILSMLSTHGEKDLLTTRALAILDENPHYLPAHLQLLRTGRYPGNTQQGVVYLRDHQKKRTDAMEYAVADGFDKEGDTEASFRFYLRANKKKQEQSRGYGIKTTIRHHERLRRFYEKYANELLSPVEDSSEYPTPIFILGMPRSGTSLTEQLLGSHSEIYPAGELQFLLSLSKFGMHEFRGVAKQRTREYWNWVRDAYLLSLREISAGKRFVTDKMPHNYELVGFIRRLFPNAILIHSQRDPLSNCLSIFKANFGGYHPYAQDMKTLGLYYAEYRNLMSFWREQPDAALYESSYEELVEDTRSQIESMLALCSLEWEDQISEFHKADRIVRTASNDQVRQPIYKSSIKSWKRYEKQLKPLIDTLLGADVITEKDLE